MSDTEQQHFVQMIPVMRNLFHENLVNLISVLDDGFPNYIRDYYQISLSRLIQEKIQNSEWFQKGNILFPPVEIVNFLEQILKGLEYLHSNDIAHKNLKV